LTLELILKLVLLLPEENRMAQNTLYAPFASVVLACALLSGTQQDKPAPQQKPAQTDDQHQGVIERGDHEMGFSHVKTTHHFRLFADGGAIEADAKDAQDTASRDAIRMHFAHIAKLFAAGDFEIPMLIHAQNPPGAETMKHMREAIRYKLENTEHGGRIRITTKNAEALQAVHSFLRFQISDHQTGDSPELTKER
jgi:hypothetical protein